MLWGIGGWGLGIGVALSFKELEVWSRAMDLATSIYALTDGLPKREEYRLTAQLIRAAISVPANIAEGHARATRKDYAHFVSIARGSVAEIETLLLLTTRAGFLSDDTVYPVLQQAETVARMLNKLHGRLKAPP
jgi:four helix bundle protein